MTSSAIIEDLARRQVVESMCMNIAHTSHLSEDLRDLAQSVYLILLEYDKDKIVTLYEKDALGFFIARIIANQYLSKTSPFYKLFSQFRSLSNEMNPNAYDEDDELAPISTR